MHRFQSVAEKGVMKRISGTVYTGAVLTFGLLWPSATAHANPPALCQYQLGDKIATIACDADPQAEPGMAGNMPVQLPPQPAPPAAFPGSGQPRGAQRYLSELDGYVHPNVSSDRLIELGNLACSARRSGVSTDAARMVLWQNLKDSGVVSNNAETGTLVHVAVDILCPEVGYP
jgi:Protein of unknown function (DUF732)